MPNLSTIIFLFFKKTAIPKSENWRKWDIKRIDWLEAMKLLLSKEYDKEEIEHPKYQI